MSTKRIKYDFELRRNLTIIKGDSATGKTTLVEMIRDYVNDPAGSPVELSCDKRCFVVEGALWKEQLSGLADSIVFIDEGNSFIRTTEFADVISKTDNYYVIITRESLPALPYSVEEIYGIRTSGKYGSLKQSYHEMFRLYGRDTYGGKLSPDVVVTEDSNAGYSFFSAICSERALKCESTNGKSNIFHYLNQHDKDGRILVIADGAAFGPEIDRVLQLIKGRKNIALYLPESFEWLVLSAGLINDKYIDRILENTSDYVECRDYFSWERFFTAVLIDSTKDTYLAYSKKRLNPSYLSDGVKARVLEQMKIIELSEAE